MGKNPANKVVSVGLFCWHIQDGDHSECHLVFYFQKNHEIDIAEFFSYLFFSPLQIKLQ